MKPVPLLLFLLAASCSGPEARPEPDDPEEFVLGLLVDLQAVAAEHAGLWEDMPEEELWSLDDPHFDPAIHALAERIAPHVRPEDRACLESQEARNWLNFLFLHLSEFPVYHEGIPPSEPYYRIAADRRWTKDGQDFAELVLTPPENGTVFHFFITVAREGDRWLFVEAPVQDRFTDELPASDLAIAHQAIRVLDHVKGRPNLHVLEDGRITWKKQVLVPHAPGTAPGDRRSPDHYRILARAMEQDFVPHMRAEMGPDGVEVPRDPILVRVVRETPVEKVRPVFEVCGRRGIRISRIHLGVTFDPPGKPGRLELSLPFAPDAPGAEDRAVVALQVGRPIAGLEGQDPARTVVQVLAPDGARWQEVVDLLDPLLARGFRFFEFPPPQG